MLKLSAIIHMSDYEKKQLERAFRKYTNQHLEKPSRCKNLVQIQFFINELSTKISDYKQRFNYVPDHAYMLLSDYNTSQNKLIFSNFRQADTF